MELSNLHQSIEQTFYSLMRMQKGNDLLSSAEQILKLLEENQSVLEERTHSHLVIYLVTAIFSAIAAMFFLSTVFDKPLHILLGAAGLSLLGVLIAYLITGAVSYKIDTAIVLSYKLSKKGWRFSTLDPEGVWDRWRLTYPFLDKGDMDNAIALRIYGEYEAFSFCYFEYDYTIEVEEEVEHEDSNGNTYYETEYSYEYYTESGVIIDVDHNLPHITVLSGPARSDALKFSYIDLNAKMSAHSADRHKAALFFDPSTQRVFADVYHWFPAADMSIQKGLIFINFATDMSNLSRSMRFDENLLSYIRGNRVADKIEGVMRTLLPLMKALSR